MKKMFKITILAASMLSLLNASTAIADEYTLVENMNKGIDGYVVGKALTKDQQKVLTKNSLASNNKNISKFLVDDNLIIAVNKHNNKVLVINKRYPNIDQKETQKMISKYIYDFDEPTAMAHDKMVYWIYDKNGTKLTEDDLKKWKDSLKAKSGGLTLAQAVNTKTKKVDFNPYLSFKLSSSEAIMTKLKEPKPSNVNIVISSDKLIQETTGMEPIK